MGEQDSNSAVFAECKWKNEGALFPVFKDRIYKGMYGKGRENGKCNAGEVCGYCKTTITINATPCEKQEKRSEMVAFSLCKIRNNYCKTAIHTKIAEKFHINGN